MKRRVAIIALVLGNTFITASQQESIEARVRLSRTLVQEGRIPEALRQLKPLLELNPLNPEAQYQAARLFEDLAESRFEKLQKLAPDSAETHELLGKHCEARGELEQALNEYRLALERNPNGAGLHFLIGNLYWKSRELDKALPELEAELRVNPDHALANYRIGDIYASRHESRKAIPYLERAVRGDPELLEARRDLGKALRLEGRYSEALRELKHVADARPEDDSVHAQLAAVYKALGDSKRAAEELALHRQILERRREAAQRR